MSTIRLIVGRNLSSPLDGLVCELDSIQSEPCWDVTSGCCDWATSRNARKPFLIRIWACRRLDFAGMSLVEQVAGSRPASREGWSLMLEARIDAENPLVEIDNVKNLTGLVFPENSLFFVDASGKLFFPKNQIVQFMQMQRRNVTLEVREIVMARMAEEQPVAGVYERMVEVHGKAKIDRLKSASDSKRETELTIKEQERVLNARLEAVTMATERAFENKRRAELAVQRQAQCFELLTEIESLESDVTMLETKLGELTEFAETTLAAEADDAKKNHAKLKAAYDVASEDFARVTRLLDARRFVIANDVFNLYPLSIVTNGNPEGGGGTAGFAMMIRGANLDSTNEEERAMAFGYLSHLISLLASTFDISLRFAPVAYGSRSFMMDTVYIGHLLMDVAASHTFRVDSLASASALASTSGLYPLFIIGLERGAKAKFALGVQAITFDIKQLVEKLRARYSLSNEAANGSRTRSNSAIAGSSLCRDVVLGLRAFLVEMGVLVNGQSNVIHR